MLTDLVEIQRLGEQKQAENLSFRRYLSAHHRSLEPLQALATEIQHQVDCTQCANCCRYSLVSVSGPEIHAIAEYLGILDAEAMRLYTAPDADAQGERILKTSDAGCVFLDGNLCAVYDARPKACRDFPHVIPGCHTLGGRIASLCRWVSHCPILYNAFEQYKQRIGYHC